MRDARRRLRSPLTMKTGATCSATACLRMRSVCGIERKIRASEKRIRCRRRRARRW